VRSNGTRRVEERYRKGNYIAVKTQKRETRKLGEDGEREKRERKREQASKQTNKQTSKYLQAKKQDQRFCARRQEEDRPHVF
jgi:hypothetical protein